MATININFSNFADVLASCKKYNCIVTSFNVRKKARQDALVALINAIKGKFEGVIVATVTSCNIEVVTGLNYNGQYYAV